MAVSVEIIENAVGDTLENGFRERLSSLVIAIVEQESIFHASEVFITFVGKEEMQKINFEHRKIDMPTDVLSFPLLNVDELKRQVDSPVILGDIFVSLPNANEQAEMLGHSFEREVAFLCAHGVLHLLGFDHFTVDGEAAMTIAQEKYLADFGFQREIYAY